MPIYTFKCQKCNEQFEINCLMSDYPSLKPDCPQCSSLECVRDYQTDLENSTTGVKLSEDQLTVGHLAYRNTERMSQDERSKIYLETNAYKKHTKIPDHLFKGVPSLGPAGKRQASTEQRNKDPKRAERLKRVRNSKLST